MREVKTLGRHLFTMMDERRIHQLFVVSILLKGLHALIEIAGGIALYFFSTDAIIRWRLHRTAGESNDLDRHTSQFDGPSRARSTISTLSTCSATAS